MTREQPPQPAVTRSPWRFFLLAAALYLPFPLAAGFLHIPGLPKNTPVTDFAGAFVPAVAALVLAYRSSGSRGVRGLLLRTVDHRRIGSWTWYLPILGLPVVSLAATWALLAAVGVRFPPQNSVSSTTALLFAVVYLLAAAGEELGWSGYAVEPLQQRFGALGAAVVLGLVWWAFHLPSILQSGEGPVLVALGPVASVATRVLWLWLFNNTGGSVFAMILVHTASNMCGAYVPGVPTSANAPVLVVLAALVIVRWGPGTLARATTAPAPGHSDP